MRHPRRDQRQVEALNVEAWTDRQIRAHLRLYVDSASYRAEVEEVKAVQAAWVEDQLARPPLGPNKRESPVSRRRTLLDQARLMFPKPDPMKWGTDENHESSAK